MIRSGSSTDIPASDSCPLYTQKQQTPSPGMSRRSRLQIVALFIGTPCTKPGMAKSNPRVPIETALAPIGLAEVVGDFDRPDPFGVLVTELGRSAQPRSILGGY